MNTQLNKRELIEEDLVNYTLEMHPSNYNEVTLPRNQSLVELGVIDSFGVVELVAFIEEHWSIVIPDEEINTKNMGGINRMADFILKKKL